MFETNSWGEEDEEEHNEHSQRTLKPPVDEMTFVPSAYWLTGSILLKTMLSIQGGGLPEYLPHREAQIHFYFKISGRSLAKWEINQNMMLMSHNQNFELFHTTGYSHCY